MGWASTSAATSKWLKRLRGWGFAVGRTMTTADMGARRDRAAACARAGTCSTTWRGPRHGAREGSRADRAARPQHGRAGGGALRRRAHAACRCLGAVLARARRRPVHLQSLPARRSSRSRPTWGCPNGLDADFVSRDREVVQAYRSDPLVHGKVTARLVRAIVDGGAAGARAGGAMERAHPPDVGRRRPAGRAARAAPNSPPRRRRTWCGHTLRGALPRALQRAREGAGVRAARCLAGRRFPRSTMGLGSPLGADGVLNSNEPAAHRTSHELARASPAPAAPRHLLDPDLRQRNLGPRDRPRAHPLHRHPRKVPRLRPRLGEERAHRDRGPQRRRLGRGARRSRASSSKSCASPTPRASPAPR